VLLQTVQEGLDGQVRDHVLEQARPGGGYRAGDGWLGQDEGAETEGA